MVVQHADLVASPYTAAKKLHADLVAAGVAGLTLPTEAQVGRLLKPSTHKAPLYLAAERKVVGEGAQAISKALSGAASALAAAPAPAQ